MSGACSTHGESGEMHIEFWLGNPRETYLGMDEYIIIKWLFKK